MKMKKLRPDRLSIIIKLAVMIQQVVIRTLIRKIIDIIVYSREQQIQKKENKRFAFKYPSVLKERIPKIPFESGSSLILEIDVFVERKKSKKNTKTIPITTKIMSNNDKILIERWRFQFPTQQMKFELKYFFMQCTYLIRSLFTFVKILPANNLVEISRHSMNSSHNIICSLAIDSKKVTDNNISQYIQEWNKENSSKFKFSNILASNSDNSKKPSFQMKVNYLLDLKSLKQYLMPISYEISDYKFDSSADSKDLKFEDAIDFNNISGQENQNDGKTNQKNEPNEKTIENQKKIQKIKEIQEQISNTEKNTKITIHKPEANDNNTGNITTPIDIPPSPMTRGHGDENYEPYKNSQSQKYIHEFFHSGQQPMFTSKSSLPGESSLITSPFKSSLSKSPYGLSPSNFSNQSHFGSLITKTPTFIPLQSRSNRSSLSPDNYSPQNNSNPLNSFDPLSRIIGFQENRNSNLEQYPSPNLHSFMNFATPNIKLSIQPFKTPILSPNNNNIPFPVKQNEKIIQEDLDDDLIPPFINSSPIEKTQLQSHKNLKLSIFDDPSLSSIDPEQILTQFDELNEFKSKFLL
ncbi:hypothetical protein M0811_08880 [Anaeramoeba ignava]|uniref:Autophagy-related protein 13 N-terminal domain-containing protein n=1 Tax=Anaeramoeba ignava TaxID=1746090 RepID=A0A9Q0RB61_ANAIG|nr:hypothetical protein M0811_08880 [Anaeramoeba ignava]